MALASNFKRQGHSGAGRRPVRVGHLVVTREAARQRAASAERPWHHGAHEGVVGRRQFSPGRISCLCCWFVISPRGKRGTRVYRVRVSDRQSGSGGRDLQAPGWIGRNGQRGSVCFWFRKGVRDRRTCVCSVPYSKVFATVVLVPKTIGQRLLSR